MSNNHKGKISDEQLMAYADNELDDAELITRIENSPELQKRLLPFTKTAQLMVQMKESISDEMIADDLKWIFNKKNTNDSKLSWISGLKNNISTQIAKIPPKKMFCLTSEIAELIYTVSSYTFSSTKPFL